MAIKNIFFDMGNTLVHRPVDRQLGFAQLLRKRGFNITDAEFLEAYSRARQDVPTRPGTSEPGHPPGRNEYKVTMDEINQHFVDRITATARHLGLANEVAGMLVGSDHNKIELFEDTVPTLEEAKSSGFRLGIISNWDPGLMAFCDELGIGHYFDTIIASRALGYKKWWPEIFHAALASVGGRPEESIHIGDSPGSDAWGALGVGIHPIVIDRNGEYPKLFCPVIRSLEDVVPLARSY